MRDKYFVTGYTPPSGIAGGADVANLQRQLNAMGAGLTVDGVYGPKTQAAYQRMQGPSAAAQQWAGGISTFMDSIQPLLSAGMIQYTPQSDASIRADLSAALRPGVDAAIARRREQTQGDQAELDADAWSRGMGRSTYLTDMKDRQMDAEADDIAGMEAAYAASLAQAYMEAQQNERARALQAQMYNAGQTAQISKLAFHNAQGAYAAYLQQMQAAQKAPSRTARSGVDTIADAETAMLFLSLSSPEERTAVYNGVSELDRQYRDELIKSLGKSGYLQAQGMYPGE